MSKCAKTSPCGCEDQPLPLAPPCTQGTPECPNPDPCPETFRAECVIWTGADLICDTTVLATQGDNIRTVLERIVALFCNATPTLETGLGLLVPDPNGLIIGTQDRIISVDRNNCHEMITFTPVNGPIGLLFDYTDENNILVTGASSIVLAIIQSSVRFDMDVSAVTPGTYQFDLEATACGVTISAPVYLVVS